MASGQLGHRAARGPGTLIEDAGTVDPPARKPDLAVGVDAGGRQTPRELGIRAQLIEIPSADAEARLVEQRGRECPIPDPRPRLPVILAPPRSEPAVAGD